MFRGIRGWAAVAVLLLCSLPFSAAAESSSVTAALAGLTGQARLNALVMLSNTGHLAGPYSPADVDQILIGMEGLRGQTLWMLATYIQKNLTVPEILQLLRGLVQQERLNALGLLSNTGHLAGPYTPADVDQILGGMESLRGQVLGMLTTYLKSNLSPTEVALLLNGITGQDRVNALAWLSNAGRLSRPFTLSEIDAVTSIATSSPAATGGATPLMTTAAVTPWTTTSQQPSTITRGSFSSASVPATSSGAEPQRATFTSPAADAAVTSQQPPIYSRGGFTGGSTLATASAPAPPGSTSATPTAVAAMNARIARFRRLVSQQQPYLYGSTGPWDDISIVARDLPVRVLGMTDYRALYDQLYFTTFQYTGLASKHLSRASLAAQRGDLASANALLDRVLTLLTQRNASYSGAVAMANHDLKRARTYVKATYEASKWAAKAAAVGIPGASGMVDAAGSFIDFALNAQEGGPVSASKQFVTDQIIGVIVAKLPIPGLDGRTLMDAMENRAGKLLATAGVIDDLKASLSDPAARKVVIDAAKSLVALPAEYRTEAAIEPLVDRIIGADATNF